MIIPTAEYNPLFAEDGVPFREKMVGYIEREFADLLGPTIGLLKSERGLDVLAEIYAPRPAAPSIQQRAA